MSVHQRKVSQSTRITVPTTPERQVVPTVVRRSSISKAPRALQRAAKSRFRAAALLFALTAGIYILASRNEQVGDAVPILKRAPGVAKKLKEPVYKVERTILESLRLLEIELNDGVEADEEEIRYRAGHAYGSAPARAGEHNESPPTVGFIPEVSLKKDGSLIPAYDLDHRVCGRPCAFVMPAWVGEQETKAQAHLYQLGLLAVALNRTLVLPNVIRSRLGACYAQPFTYYYDAESLSRLGIPTILQSDFLTWAATRDPPPTAQVVSMLGANAEHPLGAVAFDAEVDPTLIPTKTDRKLCLSPPRAWLDFSPHSPLTLFPPEGWHKQKSSQVDYGKQVLGTLLSPEIANKTSRTLELTMPNVLAFNYEIRYPILNLPSLKSLMLDSRMPEAGFKFEADLYDAEADVAAETDMLRDFEHFPYASTWLKKASDVSTALSPFIAIHWRQETLPPETMPKCAEQLVQTLEDLASAHPDIRTVYLATDYPLDGQAHSGTFTKLITENHHSAMRYLVGHLPKSLRLTTYTQETDERTDNLDSGLLGIIDKNVAMQADVFVTGFSGSFQYDPVACGKESSFTRQILMARTARAEREPGAVRNVVDLWDVNGHRK